MSSKNLLFELGCEELPPQSLLKLSNALLANIKTGLKDAKLNYVSAQDYATPRRLAVIVNGLNNFQTDKLVEKKGPSIATSFNKNGTPNQAAQGFAKSCGTTVEKLNRLKTDKGEWLSFNQTIKGLSTEQLIPDIIRLSINLLPLDKKMHWGDTYIEFVRPVHWCILLFGNKLIKTEILGLKTDRQSIGHRFHAPQPITINHADNYLSTMEQCKVLADFSRRRTKIYNDAHLIAKSVAAIAYIEENLLDEVTAINEWPVPIIGNFDPSFLELPDEVLIAIMQTNQKYFPVKDLSGNLLPHFITFSNIESNNIKAIRQGNERVILSRLTDAEFFWNKDKKLTLEDRVGALDGILFQKTLGTLADKTQRIEKLAIHIAQQLQADVTLAKRAAHLAKADLTTDMVGEFASLQGTMGRYYALEDKEDEAVAIAIEEQYLPKQSQGPTPTSTIGQILCLADKIDTLSGIFSINFVPTGDKDPYALRRLALGCLRVLIKNKLDLDIVELITFALNQFSHNFDSQKTQQLVIDFIFGRLKRYSMDLGHTANEFAAVNAVKKPSKPLDFIQRLQAVTAFKKLPEAENLIVANKRIVNLLKKFDNPTKNTIQSLIEPQEKNLHRLTKQAATDIKPLIAQKNYRTALIRLAKLKNPVDDFFNHVLVNTYDLTLQNSRLALLSLLSKQFLKIADISKLQ